ncbi:glutathionylspermidine synthase family protein [Wukongibacter baidiensis]|uniref:glutathionylspermidine synthase family protein n=1 Tax=Wukongibacter baidiensis TaxID=1723361 RepID=UPI003D7FB776
MNRIDLDSEYINIVKNKEKSCYDDYLKTKESVKNSTAMYKGKPVPFLYMPKFYTEEDLDRFKKLTSTLMTILRKVIDRYIEDQSFREKFGFSKLLEDLILTEHGYNAKVPMARIDIFYKEDGSFKFCELNADGSSAMNEDRELSRILSDTVAFKEMENKYDIKSFELFDTWVKESVSIFREFNSSIEKPNVAIVDFNDKGSPNEFEIFKEAFKRNGYNAEIVDARDLKYQDGELYSDDMKIDFVYRRLVTRDLMERADEIPDLIKAAIEGKVCIIGPIKSQIIHNKIIFKILHDSYTTNFLTEEEVKFIKDHIPYTAKFDGEGFDYNELITDKDKYILKPMDLYASRGVYAGRDFSSEEWKKRLKECHGNDYLIQEYYTPSQSDLVEFHEGELKVSKFNNITGMYMYNEKLYGLYSRVGKNAIISGLHDCYTLPTFLVTKK